MEGHSIRYYRGKKEGKKLLFIHGLLDAAFGFRKLVPHLHPELQPILLDIPGFGLNPLPQIRYLYQLDIFADLIYTFCKRSGLKDIILVGHSMGGLIAQHLALLDKEHIFSKLILLSSANSMHPKRDEMRALLFPSTILEVENLLKHLHYEDIPEPSLLEKKILLNAWNSKEYFYLAENTIERESEIFFGEKSRAIQLPCLILSGEEDSITEMDMQKKMQEYIQNSELKFIEKARHAIHIEKGETVAKEINRFLGF
ncbi:MAG: alpha/beta hydrolase [Leptospiraceae bacterium]|nr:alpha/beta hydrolase [Leptospiraceae bacterium]MCP5498477.1 alpha/beta hydrolase [Leptospiraceae bacterium]